MSSKVYVLTDNMAPSAPIYNRINAEQRQRIDKLPLYAPYLKITFANAEGKNVTIRYKQNTDEVYLDKQIKAGVEANEPFTTNERRAVEFKNGVLVTNDEALQSYLDLYPGNETFRGRCADIREVQFKRYDKDKEMANTNASFKKRAKAANKIADLDLKGMQEMIVRLNGAFMVPPDDEVEAQNMLINYLDNSEEEGLDSILKDDLNVDEETNIFLGSLIKNKIISFSEIADNISKMKDGKWIPVKEIPDAYEPEERKRLFSDFLNSNAGKLLKDDLEKDLSALGKKDSLRKKE